MVRLTPPSGFELEGHDFEGRELEHDRAVIHDDFIPLALEEIAEKRARCGERGSHSRLAASAPRFIETHDHGVRVLGALDRLHHNLWRVDLDQRATRTRTAARH